MTRSPDILFMAEYIKNILYFATVRTGKTLKNTSHAHYFCIDDELVYENYYSDFGPLNLGCVFKYCKIVNEKLNLYLNKQIIVHYTTIDPKKKANSAFLLGCYGVLCLSLSPNDALKPILVHGQSYRPFQDATQGDSAFTISLIDCLQAMKKARDHGLFNIEDFDYEEYNKLDKLQGGDLNWIVPGKFLAFIGPVDYSVSLYHPPEMYIDYFLENNVQIVIRLNKRLYDGNVFNNAGIVHYDLFFPDGSCPPRHILQKFLQISEDAEGAMAVHCKAGLGRTGSLIGCYLIKHYDMTAHEVIGWMRICRPGSVIGHQQGWLEHLQGWLMKQGKLYRKRTFNDTEKFPIHPFGVYSIAEKTSKQQPIVFHKSPSRSLEQRVLRPELPHIARPSALKKIDDKMEAEDEEVFLTSCDLTVKPAVPMTQIKGCVIRNNTISEDNDDSGSIHEGNKSLWKKLLCCKPCVKTFRDAVWTISVRCARVAPGTCYSNRFCSLLDMVAVNETEKEQYDRRVRSPKLSAQKIPHKGEHFDEKPTASRRGSGAGEPRPLRSSSSTVRTLARLSAKSNESNTKTIAGFNPTITTFRSTNGPIIKNVNDARKFLMISSMHNEERNRQLNSSIKATPHYSARESNYLNSKPGNKTSITPFFSTASKPALPQQRRCLGRSPSPPQVRWPKEKSRATNTLIPPTTRSFLAKDASKAVLRDALSRLKLTLPRDGSIGGASMGAASLGARRDAPAPKQAPSARSDERQLATQGDMLNSIKFQRRFRDGLHSEKLISMEKTNKKSVSPKEKVYGECSRNLSARTNIGTRQSINQEFSVSPKEKVYGECSRNLSARTNIGTRQSINQEFSLTHAKAGLASRNVLSPSSRVLSPASRNVRGPARPSSPKGRRSPNTPL